MWRSPQVASSTQLTGCGWRHQKNVKPSASPRCQIPLHTTSAFIGVQIYPKDHTQLVEQWVAQTRTTAGTLIQPTDWMVIREQDNGTVVPESVKALREDIRLATGQKNAAIEATADTAELAAYITGTEYPVWPSDSPAPVESVAIDGLELAFNGGATGGATI
jgi:hypothetical protein